MSVLTLPEPADWVSGRERLTWATICGLAPAIVALGFGTRALLRGSYATALLLCALAACFVLVVIALQLVRRGLTSLRAEHDSTGTTILPDRRFTTFVIVGLILGTVSMLTIAIALPLRAFDIPLSPGMQTFSPFVAGFGALAGFVGLVVGWRRGGVGYVDVTTDGVEIANIAYTESVDWNDIADVRASADSKKTRKAVVLVRRDGTEKIIDGADIYVPGGSALYWMVRHYWQHPDNRSELTDGRAIQRLHEARFEAS